MNEAIFFGVASMIVVYDIFDSVFKKPFSLLAFFLFVVGESYLQSWGIFK